MFASYPDPQTSTVDDQAAFFYRFGFCVLPGDWWRASFVPYHPEWGVPHCSQHRPCCQACGRGVIWSGCVRRGGARSARLSRNARRHT